MSESTRLAIKVGATRVGGLEPPNPVICGAGEPVLTEAGIRAALAAGAAGVIAKSLNERPEGGAALDRADYAWVGAAGVASLASWRTPGLSAQVAVWRFPLYRGGANGSPS